MNLSTKYADLPQCHEVWRTRFPSLSISSRTIKGFGWNRVEGVDWTVCQMNSLRLISGSGPQAVDEIVVDE